MLFRSGEGEHECDYHTALAPVSVCGPYGDLPVKCDHECDHHGCEETCEKGAYHDHGTRVDYLVKGEKEGEHVCRFHNRTRPAPDSVEALEAESARLSQKLKGEPQQDVEPEVERPFARSPAFHTGDPQSEVEPEPRQSEVEPEPRLAPEQGLGVDAGVEDDGSARDVAEASVLDQAPMTPEGPDQAPMTPEGEPGSEGGPSEELAVAMQALAVEPGTSSGSGEPAAKIGRAHV